MAGKYLNVLLFLLCLYSGNAQSFYRMDRTKLFSYDINTCERMEEFDFSFRNLESEPHDNALSFHPDGHIYFTTKSSYYLYRYHPIRKEIKQTIKLNTPTGTTHLVISEEGRAILSNSDSYIDEIYDYDLRRNIINQTFDKSSIPTRNPKYVGGILKEGFFLMPTMIDFEEGNWGMWNPESGEIRPIPIGKSVDNLAFLGSSIYYPPCHDFSFFAINYKDNFEIIWVDSVDLSIKTVCDDIKKISFVVGANPTDFR